MCESQRCNWEGLDSFPIIEEFEARKRGIRFAVYCKLLQLTVSHFYDCQPLPCSPNSDSIFQAINNVVRSLGTNQNYFCLLLSDAANSAVTPSGGAPVQTSIMGIGVPAKKNLRGQ